MKNIIFVDYTNKEHARWWNTIARTKLVRFELIHQEVDKETNEPVAAVFNIEGLFAKLVVKLNNMFISDLDVMNLIKFIQMLETL